MKTEAQISLFLMVVLATTAGISIDLSQLLSFGSQQNYVAENSDQKDCSPGTFGCPHT